jgi:hypothetical protein
MERFKQAYQESLLQYNYDPRRDIKSYLQELWDTFDEKGETAWFFDSGIFNIREYKDMVGKFQHVLVQKLNEFQKEFYRFVPNSQEYDYLLIMIYKRKKNEIFICTPERWAVFNEILKTWIKILKPQFVWGDWFKTLKEEGDSDSRLNIWSYQYYPQEFVDAIGKESFDELLKDNTTWNLERIEDGLILCGNPHPCAINKRLRTKAKELLRLDERLEGIIQKKIPVQPDVKERPPEGVIE